MVDGKNLLHTHSGYAHYYIDTSFIQQIGKHNYKKDIDRMEKMELKLYQQFEAKNYKDFLNKIREFFGAKDQQVIQNFEANKLSDSLKKFATTNSELLDQRVKVIIDPSRLDEIKIPGLETKGIKLRDKSKLSFEAIYNVVELKKAFNEMFLGHRFKAEEGTSEKALNRMIRALQGAGAISIQVSSGESNNSEYVDYVSRTIPNYPWGVTKDILESANIFMPNGENQIRKDLIDAIQRIKHFIFYELGEGASLELRQAMMAVWTRNFTNWQDPAKFFAGTTKDNFISLVQGSLGEFQAAVMFEYLRNKRSTSPALTRLIGNVYQSGEQGKTDVEIFKSIGLQVKNINTIGEGKDKTFLRDIATSIHPGALAKKMQSEGFSQTQDFLGFLSNYFFNLTYQEQEKNKFATLQAKLGDWLGFLMNMAITDSMEDSVSFYLIGGKYLVPCSVILKAAQNIGLKNSITIESKFKGMTNNDYNNFNDETKTAPYEKFWTYSNGGWSYTDQNVNTYYQLINKRISIQSNFNFFQEIEKYALWEI